MKSLYALIGLLCVTAYVGMAAQPAEAATTQQRTPYAASVATFPATPTKASTPAIAATPCTYRVKSGDWLSKIAPSNWRQVAIQNHIANPNYIYVGQVLNLCVGSAANAPVIHAAFIPSGGASFGAGAASPHIAAAAVIPASSTAKGASSYAFGWCTWGAEQLAHDNLNNLGDASMWFNNAQRRGLPTGYVAQPDSTAVFQAGYHVRNWGTSGGHVAHVDAVSGNMMEITEMNNAYWGGFGKWDTIWIQIVSGVSFIY